MFLRCLCSEKTPSNVVFTSFEISFMPSSMPCFRFGIPSSRCWSHLADFASWKWRVAIRMIKLRTCTGRL